jgi:hypothetical protein
LGFAAKLIARMLRPYNIEITQALANGIRGYKNKVRLRGLTKIKGFETCVGRFRLYSCGFNRPAYLLHYFINDCINAYSTDLLSAPVQGWLLS